MTDTPSSTRFAVAPWPATLCWVSGIGTLAMAGLAYAAWRAVPVPAGFTHAFGLGVALVPLVVLAGALLAVVRGYRLERDTLYVRRLLTTSRIPLATLQRAWVDPGVCRGSVRVIGNGGLYSFSGQFYNKRLGRYRLLATDFRHGVVLQFRDGALVVSPADPQAFVARLRAQHPGLAGRPDPA